VQADKKRIALFGSFYRGFHMLDELLHGPLRDQIEVVGVATDDPNERFISREKRFWQYPHREEEETMVRRLAQAKSIDTWTARVKTPEFYERFETVWRPDLCIAASFGQRIDARLFEFPSLGFYNLHPVTDTRWPSPYAGPNPFQAIKDDGYSHACVAFHMVDAGFDTGRLIAVSDRIGFSPDATVIDLHKLTSPVAAKFAIAQISAILRAGGPPPAASA
jgi:methionyl-tRNA formyltransferase